MSSLDTDRGPQVRLSFTERFPQSIIAANESRLLLALHLGLEQQDALTISQLRARINTTQGLSYEKKNTIQEIGVRQEYRSVEKMVEELRAAGIVQEENKTYRYVNSEQQIKAVATALALLSLVQDEEIGLQEIIAKPPDQESSINILSELYEKLQSNPSTSVKELLHKNMYQSVVRNYITEWAELGLVDYQPNTTHSIRKGEKFSVLERIYTALQLNPQTILQEQSMVMQWMSVLTPGFNLDLRKSPLDVIKAIAQEFLQRQDIIQHIMTISNETSSDTKRAAEKVNKERIVSALIELSLTAKTLRVELMSRNIQSVPSVTRLRKYLHMLERERIIVSSRTRHGNEQLWSLSQRALDQIAAAREQTITATQTRKLSLEEIQEVAQGEIFQEYPALVKEIVDALQRERRIKRFVDSNGEKWGNDLLVTDPEKAWEGILDAISYNKQKVGIVVYHFQTPQDIVHPAEDAYKRIDEQLLLFFNDSPEEISQLTQEDLPQGVALDIVRSAFARLQNNLEEKKENIPVAHELVIKNTPGEINQVVIVFDTSRTKYTDDELKLTGIKNKANMWPYGAIIQEIAHVLLPTVVPNPKHKETHYRDVRRDSRSFR